MGKSLSHWLNLRFKYSSCLDKWSRWVFKFITVLFVLSIFLLKRFSLVVKTSTVWGRFNGFLPLPELLLGTAFQEWIPENHKSYGERRRYCGDSFFFQLSLPNFFKNVKYRFYQWSTNRKKVWYYTYPTTGHQMFHHWGGNDISIKTGCIITLVVGYFCYWHW